METGDKVFTCDNCKREMGVLTKGGYFQLQENIKYQNDGVDAYMKCTCNNIWYRIASRFI